MNYNLKALKSRTALNDSIGIGISLANMGVTYCKLDNILEAERLYNEALHFADDYTKRHVLMNLALLKIKAKDWLSFRTPSSAALRVAPPGSIDGTLVSYNFANGLCYKTLGPFDSAIYFFQKSPLGAAALADKRFYMSAKIGIAQCHQSLKRPDLERNILGEISGAFAGAETILSDFPSTK